MNRARTTAMAEIAELKKKFEIIKADTEEFLTRSKKLSETGLEEAKYFLDAAKENWHGLVDSFSETSIGHFFSTPKKVTPKTTSKNLKTKSKKVSKAVITYE